MSEFKTLNQLLEYMNDHPGIFDWKSRCEALTEFAEGLENELTASKSDRVATSQKLSDALESLFVSNKLLSEARAEVEGAIKLCGEYAISAREGIFASLALSIGRLKHQIECELEHKKKLSDHANSGAIANEKLFDRLTEARAEIERLKGVVISQITPEPFVISSYSTTAEPAKDERDKLVERMKNCQNCGRGMGFCKHCRYNPDKRGFEDNWKEPI